MDTELSTLTELERGTLLTFDPYDEGVAIDPDRLKPEIITTARDLEKRGFMVVSDADNGQLHFMVTVEGRKITQPWTS